MEDPDKAWKGILTFIALTFALSTPFYIITAKWSGPCAFSRLGAPPEFTET